MFFRIFGELCCVLQNVQQRRGVAIAGSGMEVLLRVGACDGKG